MNCNTTHYRANSSSVPGDPTATRGALLSNYHALTHPSQPNYISLTAGSAYGLSSDNPVTIDVPHLGDLLEHKGLDWKVYAEQYPGNCYLGGSAGDIKTGQYARKHVPFLSFTDVQQDPERCRTRIVNSMDFDADVAAGTLPRFSLYVPNTIHDGHDSNVATADAWLQSRFGSLLNDPQFLSGLLFVVVFDEGRSSNLVYCSLFGAGVQPGSVSDRYYDHYDLLRTLERIFDLGSLHHHDDAAKVIDGIWKR